MRKIRKFSNRTGLLLGGVTVFAVALGGPFSAQQTFGAALGQRARLEPTGPTLPRVTSLGLNAVEEHFQLDEQAVVVLVDESVAGDLNGDGDNVDDVLHVYDISSKATINTGLAVLSTDLRYGEGIACFVVSEAAQGGTDLNGDSDTNDRVAHVHEVDGHVTTNLGFAATGYGFTAGTVAFSVSESDQGNADLNGDFDSSDEVLHLHELSTAMTTNTMKVSNSLVVGGGLLVYEDVTFRVHEVVEGVTIDTGLRRTPAMGFFSPVPPQVSDGKAALLADEQDILVDYNGDGDKLDVVLHVYDAQTNTTHNTGVASGHFVDTAVPLPDARFVAFVAVEADQGGMDLNGDGDTADAVLHLFEPATAIAWNSGQQTSFYDLDGDLASIVVTEEGNGSFDYNGDGDIGDMVLRVFEPGLAIMDTGVACAVGGLFDMSQRHVLSEDWIVFGVPECEESVADRNGDGDTLDVVATVFEISTGQVENLAHWVNDCPIFIGLDALALDGSRFLYLGESVSSPGRLDELYWRNTLSDVGGAVGIEVDRAFNGPTILQKGSFATFLVGGVVHLLSFE